MTPSIACDASDSRSEETNIQRCNKTHDKAYLRSTLLKMRKSIQEDQRRSLSTTIGEYVINWAKTLAEDNPKIVIGVYWPIRNEPDLCTAYDTLIAQGIGLALPVVVDKDAALRFVQWIPGDALTKDGFGITIPVNGAVVSPRILLIPCVGFNRQRLRLGYGGGFYDRTLAIGHRPITVGISYANGLVNFEGAAHDIALDLLFTETGYV
ncbi:MAG: 5-formyltetrahydrofolate cyclo-ligase [Glaciimonas sp.]|nr:5-formyltetrahydrofolate cyclo-ligase [Glaciimonas sp.]